MNKCQVCPAPATYVVWSTVTDDQSEVCSDHRYHAVRVYSACKPGRVNIRRLPR